MASQQGSFMNVICHAGLFAVVLMLCACAAPRMENLTNPGADLQVDTAACERNAARAVKMDQFARPNTFPSACVGCPSQASQQMRETTIAFDTHKRCMAARGWRQTS